MKSKTMVYVLLIFLSVLVEVVHAGNIKRTITVGYIPLNSQLPLIISYENSKLIYENVEIDLVKYRSFTSLEAALRVGAIEIADLPVPMIFDMVADGVKVKIIGKSHTGGSVLEGVGINTLYDLKDKIIGVPGVRSDENLRLIKVLSAEKLVYGIDYKTIKVPFHTILSNLEKRKINVMYFPEPYATLAETHHISPKTIQGNSRLQGGITTVLCAKDNVLGKKYKQAMAEWLTSLEEACRFIENDIDKFSAGQTAIIQESYFGFKREVIQSSLLERRGNIQFLFSTVDKKALVEILQETIQNNILRTSPTLKNITADIDVVVKN